MSGSHRLCLRALGVALAVVCLLAAPIGFVFAQDVAETIVMSGVTFAPTTIHIQPGQTVMWTNSSPLQHTVTADDGSFDSGMIDPDGMFMMTFDAPGTYQYYCQPHGSAGLHGMAATIIVDEANAANAQDVTDAAMPTTLQAAPAQPALVRPDEYYPDH